MPHWSSISRRCREQPGALLYGFLLDDPPKVLRAGSSVLMTWDFPFAEEVDAGVVGAYVAEAIRRNPEYLANREGMLDKGRATAAKAGRRPKAKA